MSHEPTPAGAPKARFSAKPSPAEPILQVTGAVKAFDSRTALGGVDLSLYAGTIYALLGPNGAGKTTLLRAICGRLQLDAGTVRIAGGDPRRDREARTCLGLVPQQIALYPYLSTRENLEVLGRLAGVSRAGLGAAVDRALAWTDLADRSGDRVDRLSGGMQRRLNLAAGTLHRPTLLLLDEPTVGVDPQARDRLHELLRQLRDDGMGILITTHDMDEAEGLADRTGILVDGRLRVEGRLDALVREHFGRAKELTVRVTSQIDAAASQALEAAGLARVGAGAIWAGRLEGFDELAEVGRRIAAAGLATDELRVREPGLREVFFRVTGREFAP